MGCSARRAESAWGWCGESAVRESDSAQRNLTRGLRPVKRELPNFPYVRAQRKVGKLPFRTAHGLREHYTSKKEKGVEKP